MRSEPWKLRAACRGMDTAIFYPGRGESAEPALAVCRRCDVRAECMAYCLRIGLANRYGIWGGTSEYDRSNRRLRSVKS